MENLFYLLNVTVSGIKNIKKDVRLDFYKKTVDKNFDPDCYRIKAIYGENGSGKSALVTAVKIFQDLILMDNYLNESKNQNFLEEIVNKETQFFKFNCEYLVDFGTSKRIYNYTICLGKNLSNLYEIKYEKLMSKNGNYPNSYYKVQYECRDGKITDIGVEDNEKEFIVQKTLNLLSSRSMINLNPLHVKRRDTEEGWIEFPVQLSGHIFLCSLFVISLKVYLADEDQHELYFLRKRLKDREFNPQGLEERLLIYIENINTNVNEKFIDKSYYERYKEKVTQLTQFIKIFKPELQSIDIDKKENGEQYACELILNYGSYKINKEFESTGIKKLISLFDCFAAASNHGIVFIDEMDSNLNDIYLCRMIEYFMYYGKGQLCFTTHNLDPMIPLKENKNSIDFLSNDNHLIQWTSRGNSSPDNCYRNGMIEDSPFNVDATDFVGIFGE